MKSTPFRYMNEQIGFYRGGGSGAVGAGQEADVTQQLCLGAMDTAGRVQYLIDGRMGSPFAARRIMETADLAAVDRQAHLSPLVPARAVDRVLNRHNLAPG